MDDVLWHSATCAVLEIDFGEDSQAAYDPRDRVPVHLHEFSDESSSVVGAVICLCIGAFDSRHCRFPLSRFCG